MSKFKKVEKNGCCEWEIELEAGNQYQILIDFTDNWEERSLKFWHSDLIVWTDDKNNHYSNGVWSNDPINHQELIYDGAAGAFKMSLELKQPNWFAVAASAKNTDNADVGWI